MISTDPYIDQLTNEDIDEILTKMPWTPGPNDACENCGSKETLDWYVSHTCYAWDGAGEDPNRDQLYCDGCGHQHEEFWSDQWAEYYRGCL